MNMAPPVKVASALIRESTVSKSMCYNIALVSNKYDKAIAAHAYVRRFICIETVRAGYA